MQKNLKYKVGALKRKFKTDSEEPGTFITKMNESKSNITTKKPLSKTQVAIRGMV